MPCAEQVSKGRRVQTELSLDIETSADAAPCRARRARPADTCDCSLQMTLFAMVFQQASCLRHSISMSGQVMIFEQRD